MVLVQAAAILIIMIPLPKTLGYHLAQECHLLLLDLTVQNCNQIIIIIVIIVITENSLSLSNSSPGPDESSQINKHSSNQSTMNELCLKQCRGQLVACCEEQQTSLTRTKFYTQ